MENVQLHIKNMVCRRCVLTVEDICRSLGIEDAKVSLGMVEFKKMPEKEIIHQLYEKLENVGFEPLESGDLVLIEKIKALVRFYARNMSAQSVKLSSYIEDSIAKDFRYVSRLFSSIEGRTIQKYLMLQRIEYVKELLLDNDLTLTEISYEAGFSSVAHLSTTFKKQVGLNISDFKNEGIRSGIDEI